MAIVAQQAVSIPVAHPAVPVVEQAVLEINQPAVPAAPVVPVVPAEPVVPAVLVNSVLALAAAAA